MKSLSRKREYKVNLIRLHETCEINYQRLMKLLPNLSENAVFYFPMVCSSGQLSSKVIITIIQCSPYTTLIEMDMSFSCDCLVTPPKAKVRLYHDVLMAEVVYHRQQQIQPKYLYPNPQMYQPNEKEQHNQFLAYWLNYLLAGQSRKDDD